MVWPPKPLGHHRIDSFRVLRQSFCGTFQIVCGFWKPAKPAFRMYANSRSVFFQVIILLLLIPLIQGHSNYSVSCFHFQDGPFNWSPIKIIHHLALQVRQECFCILFINRCLEKKLQNYYYWIDSLRLFSMDIILEFFTWIHKFTPGTKRPYISMIGPEVTVPTSECVRGLLLS